MPILHAAVLGVADQVGPDLGEPLQVVVQRQLRVGADERVDDVHAQAAARRRSLCGGACGQARLPPRRPRADSRSSPAPRLPRRAFRTVRERRSACACVKSVDVDVPHAAILPVRPALGPAHHLDALISPQRRRRPAPPRTDSSPKIALTKPSCMAKWFWDLSYGSEGVSIDGIGAACIFHCDSVNMSLKLSQSRASSSINCNGP